MKLLIFSHLEFSSTVLRLIGIVAALLDVENANNIEFFILEKNLNIFIFPKINKIPP